MNRLLAISLFVHPSHISSITSFSRGEMEYLEQKEPSFDTAFSASLFGWSSEASPFIFALSKTTSIIKWPAIYTAERTSRCPVLLTIKNTANDVRNIPILTRSI